MNLKRMIKDMAVLNPNGINARLQQGYESETAKTVMEYVRKIQSCQSDAIDFVDTAPLLDGELWQTFSYRCTAQKPNLMQCKYDEEYDAVATSFTVEGGNRFWFYYIPKSNIIKIERAARTWDKFETWNRDSRWDNLVLPRDANHSVLRLNKDLLKWLGYFADDIGSFLDFFKTWVNTL